MSTSSNTLNPSNLFIFLNIYQGSGVVDHESMFWPKSDWVSNLNSYAMLQRMWFSSQTHIYGLQYSAVRLVLSWQCILKNSRHRVLFLIQVTNCCLCYQTFLNVLEGYRKWNKHFWIFSWSPWSGWDWLDFPKETGFTIKSTKVLSLVQKQSKTE